MDALFNTVFGLIHAVLTFTVWDIAVWQVCVFALVIHYVRLAWQHEKYLRKSFRYEWAYLKAKAMGKNPERRRWGGSFHTDPSIVKAGEHIDAPIKKRKEGMCFARQSVEASRKAQSHAGH